MNYDALSDDQKKALYALRWQRRGERSCDKQLCILQLQDYNKDHYNLLSTCKKQGFEVIDWSYGEYRIGFAKKDIKKFIDMLSDTTFIKNWCFV